MYTGGRCRRKEEYLVLKDLKTINKLVNRGILWKVWGKAGILSGAAARTGKEIK